MRNVLTSDEIATAWARQTQPSARCSSHMSFGGNDFYSYSTVVASIVHYGDKTAYLVTDSHYSDTTSRHINLARCAVPREAKVFRVIGTSEGGYNFSNFDRILTCWRAEVRDLLEESANAREPKKTRLLIEAHRVTVEMRDFADYFGLSLDAYQVQLPVSEAEILATIRLREEQDEIRRRETAERAQLAKVMRRLHGEVATRAVYNAYEAAKKASAA